MSDDNRRLGSDLWTTRRQYTALVLLLLVGALIRVAFHPGAIEPMHRVVVWPAVKILEGQFHPSSFGEFRYLLIYPAALSFALFGVNLASFSLYPFLCSLGSLLLAYGIGKRVGGVAVGLGALFVLAVLPLDIYLAGRGEWPDGPQAFFASLALWLLLVAQDREQAKQQFWLGLAVGVAIGLSCLVKQTTLFLLPAIAIYALFEKKVRLATLAIPAGLVLPFIAELALDYHLTGDVLASVRSITNLSVRAGSGKSQTLGYSSSGFFLYPKQFFIQPLMYGLHMYAAVGAVVFVILRRRPRTLLLLLWTIWFFGYMWLGTVSPTSWVRTSQFARYIAIINVPLAVLIALWFSTFRLWARWSGYALLAAGGLFMANLNVGDQGEGTVAVRLAARFLKERNDSFPVYSNLYTDSVLKFFLGKDSKREVITYGRSARGGRGEGGIVEGLGNVSEAYILFDRNFVEEVLHRYPDQQYPKEVFSPPAHWQKVLVLNNPGRKSSYAQLRLLRWVAQLPFAPAAIARKVTETIDKTLRDRDLVIFFAPAKSLGDAAVPSPSVRQPASFAFEMRREGRRKPLINTNLH